MNSETKTCQNCKKDFCVESDDFSFYEKIGVPAPTFCPECRLQRRFALRNERSFYRMQCPLCQKNIISTYSPESPVQIVYCPVCWWSDTWDPLEYGREYDFSKTFFEQYFEFKKTIPHEALYQANFINSEYANFGVNYKDCYLVSGGSDNERLYYANMVFNVSDSLDILNSNHLEFCYDTIQSSKCSQLRHCFACESSSDLFMCTDCRGCISCFGCVGLTNKQYHIFNEPYSKAEYETFLKEFSIDKYSSFEQIKVKFESFKNSLPYRFVRAHNSVDCKGDDIDSSKNAQNSFFCRDVENIKNGFVLVQTKDSYDCSCIGKGGEELYEIISSFGGSHQICGTRCLFDMNSYYCEDCHHCNNIFACSGLQKKSYCIFNKQYTKEEYEELLPKIIEHMKSYPYIDKKGRPYSFGDFWPIEFSPFGYNETKAQEYFPLTKEEAENFGFNWKEKTLIDYKVTLSTSDLPDSIRDVEDSITDAVIECEHKGLCNEVCSGAFKILKPELEFYRRMDIPLPRLCSNCRHMERIVKQNPLSLWHRSCMCMLPGHDHQGNCQNEFETTYAPDRPETIYCEKCYQQEVI